MSTMRKVIAIACGDLHLTLTPPIARTAEPNWLEAQKRPLNQLRALQLQHGDVPILCAGDIFDKWNVTPELINWVIENLPPKFYAVPGQHDMPYHRQEQMEKSAYTTLVKAGAVIDVDGDLRVLNVKGEVIDLHGFGWARRIQPRDTSYSLRVALVHQYTWMPGTGYKDAPLDECCTVSRKIYRGWRTVITGDNHTSFDYVKDGFVLFNCGAFQRRASDQLSHRPRVGLVMSNGTVETHYLDVSQDIINEITVKEQSEVTLLTGFVDQLKKLAANTTDYRAVLERTMDQRKTAPEVRALILKAMETVK